jgi:hypothetical protein
MEALITNLKYDSPRSPFQTLAREDGNSNLSMEQSAICFFLAEIHLQSPQASVVWHVEWLRRRFAPTIAALAFAGAGSDHTRMGS